jgi:hypothetical protein
VRWLTIAWVLSLVAPSIPRAAVQPAAASFRAEEVLTSAYYLQEGIKPIEEQSLNLSGNAAAEQITAAVNGFEEACNTLAAFWQQKGIDVSVEPARAQVRDTALLEQARTSLEQGDLPAARQSARQAYQALLGVAYDALAAKYSAVAERGGDWAFTAWIELAGVRLKQGQMRPASEALWKAYTSTAMLGDQSMDGVRKAFENLAERIGKGLMNQGDHETARQHFTKQVAAPELQKTEVLHAALGLTCVELGDTSCAVEHLGRAAEFGTGRTAREVLGRAQNLLRQGAEQPESYAKAFKLVEVWRQVAPADEEILKAVAAGARQDPEGLRAWFQETTDCAIKAHVVEALQQGAVAEPYLDWAEGALACDGENATAREVVATANYRLAVQAWNELAESRPKDLAEATPQIDRVRTLLGQAGDTERASELRLKVEGYVAALQENRRKENELREADLKRQCVSIHERARWATEQSRVAISDLAGIVKKLEQMSETCASRLEAAARKEYDEWQVALADRLTRECDAEYYRLPDLPVDTKALRQDQLAAMRAQIIAFHSACEPIVATSQFRAQKVQALMQGLDVTEAKP